MKLLITGGCGFLGSNLASHAIQQGMDLVVFDNLYREGSLSNLQWLKGLGKFRFVHGDIRNQNDITRLVQDFQPSAVFHLAGQVAMTTSIANPRMDFEVNAMGTHNLLEAIRLYAPDAAVIYSSTNKVYGDLEQYSYRETATRYECVDHPRGFDESTSLDFHSPYGCSKGAADQYMLDYSRIFGLKTVVFRHSSMYGGRQFATYDQGWIGWFCQQAVATKAGTLKEPFTISGNGKQVRDVLHADDMIALYFSAFENIEKAKGNAFNIGGGIENSLSLLELFGLLEEIGKLKLDYRKLPPRESDQRVFVADLAKAKTLMGWSPKVSASDGVKRMLEWVSGN
ncbi:CDP-paratose 2-epimerase [Geotalea daltonii FRC-32]|uniref:CDP-paratose 2-epimerase n=1 Tax=Geotalea daltonii (strain DSM 22248 / JCM 15807 / FRC-32) TaxID=316067 RepID=B9M8Y6_GEODF|nr:GDP-mannose 4,6-dehydratase [Geotalea daltonii]ACM20482.1 CDP-paratose 2-epimerase [Geotalea daltonii FRC-32]